MAPNQEIAHFESLYPAESRYEQIEAVLGYVKQGNSCQVVGIPGSGQSTFLKLFSYNKTVRIKHLGENQDKYHFVLINFSEVRRRPLLEVTKFMFLSLVDSLRERRMQEEYEKTYALFKETITLNDEMVLFQGLKHAMDILTLEKELTIVFLLDRFEEYIPVLTEEFFSNLRVLRNRAKYKFSVVISLNRPLVDSIEPALTADFSDFLLGHIVYLPLLDKEGINFRIRHLETIHEKKLAPSLLEIILTLTGGVGRLTKNSFQTILTSPTTVTEEDLPHFLLSQPSVIAPLEEIWNALTPSEQDFLSSTTTYETSDQDYPYLANIGLLQNGKITVPLLQIYLEKTKDHREQSAAHEKIYLDVSTNEIKQGNDIISDRLTASEYKLLHFLVEHADTVIDRETIINAVWKESVSTAGVTDQALDQLLFRMRKKIEEDPNNPQHLQTVKGRGIRFTP